MGSTTYSSGTISVGSGSTSVTGAGTSWASAGVRAGDLLIAGTAVVPIAAVTSATSITLSRGWTGGALSAANYDIMMVDDAVRSLVAANELLQQLTGGTLTSLAGLSSSADKVPYFSGNGVMALTGLTAAARSLLDDASVAAMRATLAAPGIAASSVYGTYGGSANAITVTAGLPTLAAGAKVRFRATASNTGATTLNVDGLGAKECRTVTGVALPSGYIRTNIDMVATYNGTYWVVSWPAAERGSNSNGEYVRFADGTQICTMLVAAPTVSSTSSFTGFYRSEIVIYSFPASFTATPSISCGRSTPGTGGLIGDVGATAANSGWGMRWMAPAAFTDISAGSFALTAIGRWF